MVLTLLLAIGPGCNGDSANTQQHSEQSSEPAFSFTEFSWLTSEPDTSRRICAEAANPDRAADKIFIDCEIEGESFSPDNIESKIELTVMAYNIERGFRIDDIITMLSVGSEVPRPDVLLLSEVDRGCARTGGRHIARDIAEALHMNYVYAVEFVELTAHGDGSHTADCEHGNAILSPYPLGNVRQLRHTEQNSWFEDGESRLGGRIAIAADLAVGENFVHLYSLHLESAVSETPRWQQAAEIAQDGLSQPHLVIVGGDLNCGYFSLELDNGGVWDKTVRAFTDRDYIDAHADLPRDERTTAPDTGFILDLILGNQDVFSDPQVCKSTACQGLSDHLPVWTQVTLSQ